MKKSCILLALIISTGIYNISLAENDPTNGATTENVKADKGEELFIKYADECLN